MTYSAYNLLRLLINNPSPSLKVTQNAAQQTSMKKRSEETQTLRVRWP